MERPQSRIVDQQHVESEREVTGWEAEELLRKYGYDATQFSTRQEPEHNQQPVDTGLTFEQMIAQEEAKRKQEEERRRQIQNGPKPTTFGGERGYDAEVKYSSDEDTGFNFRIEITTDMNIPKY